MILKKIIKSDLLIHKKKFIIMNPLFIDVDEILNEIFHERRWINDYNARIGDIEKSINEKLDRWSRIMIILSSSELFIDVDRISKEIINLSAFLGDLFPKVVYFSISINFDFL
jgi:hypothetical protein